MVPFSTVCGVPRLLDASRGVPPLTLLKEETTRVPPLRPPLTQARKPLKQRPKRFQALDRIFTPTRQVDHG